MSTEPINDADLVHVDEVPCFNPEKVVIARIRALEAEREALRAEVARKDEALRQIADPRNWEEQDRARSIARAALGPWRPTHQHYSGATVRVLMRISNKFVIYDFGPAGDIAPVAVTTAEFDGPAVKQNATVPRYRPLTPAEQAAYVEAAMATHPDSDRRG